MLYHVNEESTNDIGRDEKGTTTLRFKKISVFL